MSTLNIKPTIDVNLLNNFLEKSKGYKINDFNGNNLLHFFADIHWGEFRYNKIYKLPLVMNIKYPEWVNKMIADILVVCRDNAAYDGVSLSIMMPHEFK